MPDSYSYLIEAECPDCGETTTFVREFSSPYPLDQDISPMVPLCPWCGESRVAEDATQWLPVEEAEIERVRPTQEREA